ncbi:protein-export membrane protein SecD [Candidatus Azambacteria bacterium RIFOXYC1_FULL_41_20]|nr:MAG: Preprotein translocase subunit SecD [Candidatus Azambacteria bacterium GW2011_GWF1_41_10]KKS49142.1 MAG: Preprotein translocase subunit SecD [Candidatus Azambacteria bacterium GW2011_GWF2_42_22]KKT03278.1 MAG: Preprotein translocase subunit SecD [Candidatus Azambacteria bacterium GW2011_GWD1_43_18]KKT12645.1 MAG: Preprotein translocase subunit SecD [Candidatus Azambacteria bacterium GW2011_GWC2_43_27]OGD41035.1 MAG: protein-export membrane protein SecD [Candidatus Azambacteria bacterium
MSSSYSPDKIFKLDAEKKVRLVAAAIFLLAIIAAVFVYPLAWDKTISKINTFSPVAFPSFSKISFKLGLDLAGGTRLVYLADVSGVKEDTASAMSGLRDVIERRVNLFGVSEPIIEVENAGSDWRLIAELAGVKDISQAIALIGETPFLEFKEARSEIDAEKILKEQKNKIPEYLAMDPYFSETNLNGKYIKNAKVEFNQSTYQPEVSVQFDDDGAKIFEELTKKNVGKQLGIYLDGLPISAPVVREAISGGSAVISGKFTIDEAKKLTERLNAGALPVPIKLISQDSVGASLGQDSLNKSIMAGLIGFLAVVIFMILYYRFPGIVAVIALLIYAALVLALFKLIPVTLTLAGIAGFILSIGMAVDANILIFERMKEEFRVGKELNFAINDGFARAWPSIRDSNISTLITTLVLYYFTTSVVKGFALTLGIGVIVSMFSAIVTTRSFLKLFPINFLIKYPRLMGVK